MNANRDKLLGNFLFICFNDWNPAERGKVRLKGSP